MKEAIKCSSIAFQQAQEALQLTVGHKDNYGHSHMAIPLGSAITVPHNLACQLRRDYSSYENLPVWNRFWSSI